MATWALVALLGLVTAASLTRGLHRAWTNDGDFDMRARVREYECFERGVYPNRALAGEAAPPRLPYTVYPPYALPMFGFFFAPGGWFQGRVLVELLSLASLTVMGLYGLSGLRSAGPAMAAVGALAAAAITGNSSALAVGQFSIVSAGLITLQMIFLDRRRPVAAGVCWAFAMIKPQIALAFAVLFLLNRQWRGLVVGIAILAGLSLFACLWTGVPPTQLIHHWLFRMPMSFHDSASMSGPGHVAEQIGVSPRVAQFLALALLGVVAALALWLAPFSLHGIDQLRVAGACAVLGQLFFYHRHYDNIMLFPTLAGILAVAAATPSWTTVSAAVLMGATVWLPQRALELFPGHQLLQAVIWSGVAAVLLASARRLARVDAESASAGGTVPASKR
ncbi:MAG: glycosyltransferase family 87 protein [Planctomycetia bacterium]